MEKSQTDIACNNCCSGALKAEIRFLRHEFKNLRTMLKFASDDHEKRIKIIEEWKLVFVTKLTAYGSIALFLGSFISKILYNLVANLFSV